MFLPPCVYANIGIHNERASVNKTLIHKSSNKLVLLRELCLPHLTSPFSRRARETNNGYAENAITTTFYIANYV